MSSLSSFSGTTSSVTNFSVSAPNQSTMADLKTYLCPKCNRIYDLNLRANTFVGRVPLILKCNHTMCEECIRNSFNKREVLCTQCQQPSVVVENGKRKLQEIFPVNFYLMGAIYYSKPNMNEISKLSLRPAGVNYKHKDKPIYESPSSLCSEPTDVWSKNDMQEQCSQEGCIKSAVLRCADCVEVYCQSCCQTLHKAARGLQKHKVTALSGDFALELTEKCSVHRDNILEFLCNTCDKMVCAYCAIQSHQNHTLCQLTYLNESDCPSFNTLVQNAEERLKRLMLAHKKIKRELERAQNTNQASAIETSVAKYFANLHGRLQVLERNLREEANTVRNTSSIGLNELSNELLSNIRTLYRLINTAKNINDINTHSTKFNVRTIIERLENSLSLPCYLVGQQANMENVGFVCGDAFNNLEENFSINAESSAVSYQLVTEDELPEDYDTTLPSEISLAELSECSVTSPTSDSSRISFASFLRSPKDLTASQLLTNALQPKASDESSASTSAVEDWVHKQTEESGIITNIPTLKSGDSAYVTVTHIDNPECFYVQLTQFSNKLLALSKEIEQHVRNFAPILKSVELNKLYIVKYASKNASSQWSRGRVVDIILNKDEEKVYNVLFIDYGNTQLVPIKMLRKINSALAKPKPFALQCKLFNVFPVHQDWHVNAMKLMAQILTGVDTQMMVMNDSDGIWEVDLVSFCGGHTYSIREALIFIGHAVPALDTSTPIDYLKMKKSKRPSPKLHTRTENFKKEQILEVILTHVIDPHNIYVQVADYVHHIDHLSDVMARHYSKPNKGHVHAAAKGENVYVPRKDMIVAVRCGDVGPSWYRGIVTQTIQGQGMVEVFLVDYGITTTISYTDIKRLSERFRNLDCQALLMKMAGITPLNEQDIWYPNAAEFLMKYVVNKTKLRLIIVDPQKPPLVALFECYASMDVCINALMVREQVAVSTGKISENVEWIKEDNQSVKQEPSYIHDLLDTVQCSKNTYVEESDSDQEFVNKIRLQVRVHLAKSPDVIYVSLDDESSRNDQHELQQSLQNYYSKNQGSTADWQVDDPCVAFIRAKRLYFRAVIQEKHDDLNFKVILRDIAEEVLVSKGNIFVLEDQFKNFHEGTIRCHLSGVIPAGDSSKWSGLAVEFLQDVFAKHTDIFMTKDGAVDRNRKSLPIIMWYSEFKPGEALEPSKIIDHNINKLLIKKGLALRKRPASVTESDLDSTKGGHTSAETIKEARLPTLQNQVHEEKEVDSEDQEHLKDEATSYDLPHTFTTMDKYHQSSSSFKTKGYGRMRNHHRNKQREVKLPKTVKIPNQNNSVGWESASSSDDKDLVKSQPRRRKSTDCNEVLNFHQNLIIKSASATSSPQHKMMELDTSRSNTEAKKDQKTLPKPESSDWNDLIEHELSTATQIDSVRAPSPSITSSYTEATAWLPPIPFEKNDFFAYSTAVDDSAHIYLHDAKLEPVLKVIEERMKPVFDKIPPEPVGSIWVPGQLCTVKYFVNESWYRGRIVNVGESGIKVYMIDYGNEEECQHEDLRFQVMYSDVPAFANKICLYNVFPKEGSKWLTSDLDELHKQIVENKIFVTLKGMIRPNHATPALVKLGEININQFMLDNSKHLVPKRKQIKQSESEGDDVIIEEEITDDCIEHQFVSASNSPTILVEQSETKEQSQPVTIIRQISLPHAKYCHNPLPKIYESQKIKVTIVSILNYNQFIFEISNSENLIETKEQFETISEDIKRVGSKQPQLSDLEVGQACVTTFSEDGEWYRGEVYNFDNNTGAVLVWFVDFGNFETVPKDTVRAILPEWLMLPVVQYIAKVDDIELADDSDFEVVFQNLAQYCGTNKLAEILSTKPLHVRLYNEDDELAYQDLIDKKLLVLKN